MIKTQKCGRYVMCMWCEARTRECEADYLESAYDKSANAWNRRAEPATDRSGDANKTIKAALTLDEIRAMNACPVWCVDHQGSGKWALVHAADEVCTDADFDDWEFYCYGWTDSDVGWLAYRRKPEEV